jgi:O-antigen/teichoic acid export membrane protein
VTNTAPLAGGGDFVQKLPHRRPLGGAEIPEVARGSILNLAGAAISAAAMLGVTVLVTREFSRQVAGAFFTATSLFLIVEAAAGLGAYAGLVYFVARLQSTGGERRIGETLRRAIVPVIVSSIAGALLLLAFARPLAHAMLTGRQVGGASPSDVTVAVRALAAALPFAALLDTLLGATRGYRDMRPTAAVYGVGLPALQLLGALIAALLGTAALLAPLWALAYIPAATAAWLWLRRIRRGRVADTGPHRQAPDALVADLGAFWRFTAPRARAIVGRIVIQRLDIVLVAILRGPIDAAIYTAATRFLVVGQLGNAAISMAAQPQLSELFGRRDRVGAGAVYQATTAWLVLLTWPLYLLAISFGPAILSIFGHSYRTGSGVMVILGCSMLLASACGQVDVVLTSTGRSTLSLANGLVALAVNVGVDLALIPRYGIIGAAIGWAAAIVASNLIPLAQLARIIRIHPFGTATLLAGALTGVSFGVLPALVRAAFGGDAAVQIVAVLAGCAALAAGLWRWREKLQLSMMPRPGMHHWFSPSAVPEAPSSPKIT